MALLLYLKPVDGVSDPGRSTSSSLQAHASMRSQNLRTSEAVVTEDRDRQVKSFKVRNQWQFPLYGMGVCYIPSLALTLQLLSNGEMVSGPGNVHAYRVNEIFAWFNFRLVCLSNKNKTRPKFDKRNIFIFHTKISRSMVHTINLSLVLSDRSMFSMSFLKISAKVLLGHHPKKCCHLGSPFLHPHVVFRSHLPV